MRAAALLIALAIAGAARAETACEGFAWRLDAERALLASAETAPARAEPPFARRLALAPSAQANLPKAPERARSAADGHAGFTTVAVPEPGLYRVTLDGEAWLDAIQGGTYRRAEAFTGVRGCPGVRKSVRFRLDRGEVTIQVSGSATDAITVAVTRDRDAE